MLLVGLTGGIGAGKSTVSALLAERGAVVVDADQIARDIQQPGSPVLDRMAERLRNIKLPDWLTPGSPTPFEMGLRGISKALKDISTAQLPEFNAQLNVNRTGPVGAGAAASHAPTRGGNEYHLHIHTSAPTENIMADFAVLQALAG